MFVCVCFHIDNYVKIYNSSPLIFPIIISECLYSQGWLKPSTIVKQPGSVLPSQPTNHLLQHFRTKSQDKQCPHWSLVPAFQSPPHFFSAPLWRGGDAIDPSLYIFICHDVSRSRWKWPGLWSTMITIPWLLSTPSSLIQESRHNPQPTFHEESHHLIAKQPNHPHSLSYTLTQCSCVLLSLFWGLS